MEASLTSLSPSLMNPYSSLWTDMELEACFSNTSEELSDAKTAFDLYEPTTAEIDAIVEDMINDMRNFEDHCPASSTMEADVFGRLLDTDTDALTTNNVVIPSHYISDEPSPKPDNSHISLTTKGSFAFQTGASSSKQTLSPPSQCHIPPTGYNQRRRSRDSPQRYVLRQLRRRGVYAVEAMVVACQRDTSPSTHSVRDVRGIGKETMESAEEPCWADLEAVTMSGGKSYDLKQIQRLGRELRSLQRRQSVYLARQTGTKHKRAIRRAASRTQALEEKGHKMSELVERFNESILL